MRIALLQLAPAGSLEGNLRKGIASCRKAKERSADIALFPEMWSIGYDIYGRAADEWMKDAVSSESTCILSYRPVSYKAHRFNRRNLFHCRAF